MWKLLGRIFGSGDVIKEGFELIDSMHTSTEEEIQAQTEHKVRVMESYAPFKLAQRYLALMFGFTYLAIFWMVVGITLRNGGTIADVLAVCNEFMIGWIMLIIVTFYFGGGFGEGMTDKIKQVKQANQLNIPRG